MYISIAHHVSILRDGATAKANPPMHVKLIDATPRGLTKPGILG